MKKIGNWHKLIKHVFLIIGAVIMLIPFAWMILTAFKTKSEATQMNPFIIFPSQWRTQAFANVVRKMDFIKLYINTVIFSSINTFLSLIVFTLSFDNYPL